MNSNELQLYTVTDLASEFGITARAIRFYETKELLVPQRLGSTRVYNHRERARLKLILRAKRLGFSLAEIKKYLDLYEVDHSQAEQVQHLLHRVREKIRELQQQQLDLQIALEELHDIESQSLEALNERGINSS